MGWISGAVGEMWVYLKPTCCSGRSCPWVSRECLLELVTEIKTVSSGREVRRENSVWSIGDVDREEEKKDAAGHLLKG